VVHELEFLPADYVRARYQRRIGFIRSWLLLAMGLAMVLWSLQMGAWVRRAQAELESLRDTDTAIQPDVEKVRDQRSEAQVYEHRLELVQALRPRITAAEIMAAMAAALPGAVRVESAILDNPNPMAGDRIHVRITGAAPSEAAVTQTLNALEASPVLERAVLLESRALQAPDAGRSFILEADVTISAAKEP
jgi:Tfp pilus assembly protein PilN